MPQPRQDGLGTTILSDGFRGRTSRVIKDPHPDGSKFSYEQLLADVLAGGVGRGILARRRLALPLRLCVRRLASGALSADGYWTRYRPQYW